MELNPKRLSPPQCTEHTYRHHYPSNEWITNVNDVIWLDIVKTSGCCRHCYRHRQRHRWTQQQNQWTSVEHYPFSALCARVERITDDFFALLRSRLFVYKTKWHIHVYFSQMSILLCHIFGDMMYLLRKITVCATIISFYLTGAEDAAFLIVCSVCYSADRTTGGGRVHLSILHRTCIYQPLSSNDTSKSEQTHRSLYQHTQHYDLLYA